MIKITIEISCCECCDAKKSTSSPDCSGTGKGKTMEQELMEVFRSVVDDNRTNPSKPQKD